jgi:cytochrome oxidase assembly protein ShyY1
MQWSIGGVRPAWREAIKCFAPGLLPTLLVLALLPVLVALGFWQLGRGEEKRLMLVHYAERRAEDALRIDQLLTSSDPAYRRVQLLGHFDAEHSLLLDNSTREGRAGVELIQPFEDQASGVWAWVNRGWLPWPDRRVPPVFATPTQAVSLQAWVYVVPATFQLQADAVNAPWPRLVTAVDPGTLWTELGRQGFVQELRMESGLGAYRLDWPIVAMGPEKHLGYAVQWFAMATALLGLYLYLGWHQAKNKKAPEDHHGNGHQPNQHV